ncbi:MAG TPA: molybdopterin cofactor-binding domain-containing protein, partial [Ramlibacter sp.]|nr:molybdopterin cofactor-binding domain-containing protein [Ramlibacter sp.]
MDTLALAQSTRRDLLKAGALVVGFSFSGLRPAWGQALAGPRPNLSLGEVDSFLALRQDGSAVIYSGKVDLGTGHRIAMRQMVGEELSLAVERI